MKIFIKSFIVLGFVFAASAPTFAGAQQDKMNSCVNSAISRGYSLDEIANTLNARAGIDPAVVRARGYDSAEIIAKLGSTCLEKDYVLGGALQDKMKGCNVEAKDRKGNERKAFVSMCLEKLAKTDEDFKAARAAYPAAKTIRVKIKYISDPPGAVLYIATPGNRVAQTEYTLLAESNTAGIADETKIISDPRSDENRKASARDNIKSEQKWLADANRKLKEFVDSAAATGVREGYTPFFVNYPLDVDTGVKADEKQVFILPATLRWASGATADATMRIDLNRIELLKAAGTQRTFTVKRPDNVPGRAVDEEFALKIEASDREAFGQNTASCRKEAAVVEEERQAILRVNGHVSDDESHKFEGDMIAYASRCLPTARAAFIEQRLHDIHVETQMKIDAINARQQPTITIQQPTQPPVSNSIHCTSSQAYEGGQVTTNCN